MGVRDVVLENYFSRTPNAFYGTAEGLSIGSGLICDNVEYADYNPDNDSYEVVEGPVFVLTHECDVDQDNSRNFNDQVLVCPIISAAEFYETVRDSEGEEYARNLIAQISKNLVFRVFMLPPFETNEVMKDGGLLYLNFIKSVHISKMAAKNVVSLLALSESAQMTFDYKLSNHFFREKAQRLPRLR